MNSLQKDFIERTRNRLTKLSARAAGSEILSAEFLRETARTLHTIKGTSQTFGFSASSNLAHELEDLLATKKNSAELQSILIEGFALLARSFELENLNENAGFLEKIDRISNDSSPSRDTFSLQIPAEISGRFADFEKKALTSALAEGKEIFRIQAGFAPNDFAGEFKKLRERLGSRGEIIATLPGTNKKGNIEFVIYLAADDSEKLPAIAENISADIDWQSVSFENNSDDIFFRIAEYAKTLATDSGKEINVEISADKIELSREKANLIFDILLHLVRNAVDHGIETPEQRITKNKSRDGKIKIGCNIEKNGVKISVKDDGSGIDIEKLRVIAIEKNLVRREKNLTENELLDLIFLHDFSTTKTVTEISGRGIGLDAVKNLVENAYGTTDVKTCANVGTTFEIVLPEEN